MAEEKDIIFGLGADYKNFIIDLHNDSNESYKYRKAPQGLYLEDVAPDNSHRLALLSFHNGNYVCTMESFLAASSNDYRNAAIYDSGNGRLCIYNEEGMLVDDGDYHEEEFESILNSLENYRDYFNNADLTHLIAPFFTGHIVEESSKIEVPIESTISPQGLECLRISPPLYKELCINSKKDVINKENIEELLLMYAMFNSDEIPEVFTVIEKEPYSDVLKDYLDTLATLASEAMEENDEISNLEELELEAYKKAGCRDSIENVRDKQKEFQDYFRYRLIKDEKYCIVKDRYEHILNLGKEIIKSPDMELNASSYVKKDKIYFRKSFVKPDANRIGLRATIDIIKIDDVNKTIRVGLIKKIDENLEDFIDIVHKTNLDVHMAIYSELVEFDFKHLIEKKWKVLCNFMVVDKNDLHYLFEVKAGTLVKWKKKLGEQLNRADWHIKNGNFKLPYEFMNNNMSI